MTPEEILRDALDKIASQRETDTVRLRELNDEISALMARLSDAERMETAVAAILSGETVAPRAPVEAPAVDIKVTVAAPTAPSAAIAKLSKAPPESRAAGTPSVAISPSDPKPDAAPFTPAPLVQDQGRDEAIRAAKAASPSTRTERHVRILAAAAVVRAFNATAVGAAARFDIHAQELAPSMLRKIGIVEEDVATVARAIGGKKAVAPAKPAETAKVPEPAATSGPSVAIRDLADDLAQDLPEILRSCPAGAPISALTGWFQVGADEARAAVDLLVADGRAAWTLNGLQLPAGEAVPA